MAPLQPGDPAPAFALLDQEGRTVRLTDFQGQKLLLFFYPKALTSGCTKQAGSVRDARAELAELGVAALGSSPDPVDLQKKFAAKHAPVVPAVPKKNGPKSTGSSLNAKVFPVSGKLVTGVRPRS